MTARHRHHRRAAVVAATLVLGALGATLAVVVGIGGGSPVTRDPVVAIGATVAPSPSPPAGAGPAIPVASARIPSSTAIPVSPATRVNAVPPPPGKGAAPAGTASPTPAAKPPFPLPTPGQRPAGRAPAAPPELLVGRAGDRCPAPDLPGRTQDGDRLTCTSDGSGGLRWAR